MNRYLKERNTKSEAKFILIHGSSKIQEPIRWHWMTQRHKKQGEETEFMPRLTYSEKKSILSDLHKKQRATSSFKIRDGFSIKEKPRILSTATCLTSKTQKRAVQPFIYLNSNEEQLHIPNINFDILRQELVKRIIEAQMNGKNVMAILSARRMGLRYKLFHTFVQYCTCKRTSHHHDLKDITEQVKGQMKQFSKMEKQLYYFFLNRSPVHNYADILSNQPYILLVDCLPKLNFNATLLLRVVEQAEKIERVFEASDSVKLKSNYRKIKQQLEGEEEQIYDWQRIENIKGYVDKISQNPLQNMLNQKEEKKSELLTWYNQRYRQVSSSMKSSRESDKNPLFESKTHYPNEIVNKKLLTAARQRVQALQSTNNRHKFIPARLDLMMQQIKRESSLKESSEPIAKSSLLDAAISKKDLLQYLDKKNSPLTTQNIPYLIEKYGLNRFEIYNLYNLYKSFEKISLLRNSNTKNLSEVLEKGIDRETFEVGLKGLDMNPGDELIKNICYFGDFINWEQFIKIISISLRKTPEEKLTAILKGISSFDEGFLTRHQISLMIGNSLQKLFDKQQGELKQYFTDMAMRQFEQSQGKVSVEKLKQKVLGHGSQNLTMVAFLILNT